MWTDDLDFVESCDFYRCLLNFDSIDSIGAHAATNNFAYVKAATDPSALQTEVFIFMIESKVYFGKHNS